jgi:hypothetical protein
MSTPDAASIERSQATRRTARFVAALLAFHTLALAAATWPAARHLDDRLIGAPLGPLHALIGMENGTDGTPQPGDAGPPPSLAERTYRLIRPLVDRPLVAYNLIWFAGLVLYGTGASWLVLAFVPHPASAALGGLLAMLAAPVMLRSRGSLDTMALAAMAWYLAAFARFLRRPSPSSLVASLVLFALTALGGEPFALDVLLPAGVLAIAALLTDDSGQSRVARASRLLVPAACVALLAVMARGHLLPWVVERPASHEAFARSGVPLWSYVLPSTLHRASAITPVDFYHHARLDSDLASKVSYLGLATLLLIHHAWLRKAQFERRGAIVTAGLLGVLLSCGASWTLWSWTVPLPAAWLRHAIPGFRHVANPAHFNLVVSLLASIVAAAGARELFHGRIGRPSRIGIFAALALLAGLDLATTPFPSFRFPRQSPAFSRLLASDPQARLIEVPQLSESLKPHASLLDLWQPDSQGRNQVALEGVARLSSPFQIAALGQPHYVSGIGPGVCGIVGDTRFPDYAWLFLHTQGARYAVVHKWLVAQSLGASSLDDMRAAFRPGIIDEDPAVLIIDRDRLPPPARPVIAGADGWTTSPSVDTERAYASGGTLRVFVPEGLWDLQLTGRARSLRSSRMLRLTDESGHELARWDLSTTVDTPLVSMPMPLSPGWHTLTLSGEEPANLSRHEPTAARRFSLSAVALDVESLATAGATGPVPR